MKINELITKYQEFKSTLESFNIIIENTDLDKDLLDFLKPLTTENKNNILEFVDFLENSHIDNKFTLEILPGFNKENIRENFKSIKVHKGDIISIVGPTGSGKSRLLEDIEWGAQGDTPTKRVILVNNKVLSFEDRYNGEKLVAQLSQNMNFVMDLSVYDYLYLRCESRLIENVEETIENIYNKSIELAGEPFALSTDLTSLSGGQSRALMISDTAFLSKAPIILIDEIENAGINREAAIELLIKKDKIVFLATHDPILALIAQRRIVIENGAIRDIIITSDTDNGLLLELMDLDKKIQKVKENLRAGKSNLLS